MSTENETIISFKYLNHKGVTATRTITVDAVEFFGKANFGYQPGWYISGHCHDKHARRSFCLSRIIFDDDEFNHKHFYRLVTL
ncbi:hypothetical protein [Rhizobium phage RHph_X3_2]|nr:hypothetical protein [Rhizobium phage RHph_X3_2]